MLVIPVCVACAAFGALAEGVGASPPPAKHLSPAAPGPRAAEPAPTVAWCDSVVEMQTSPQSGVTSFWLSNGVRVHHLRLSTRPGQVVGTITLCGGKLLEDAKTRGLSEVSAGVLDDWDTAAPEATKATGLGGRDMRIDASAASDAIVLRLSGSAADFEAGLTVAHELLTHPTVTTVNVDAAREQVVRELRRRAADTTTAARISDALNQAVLPPEDVRLHPPDERSLAGAGPENVKAWIERHTKEGGAPIEAAFVGDLSLADALRIADKTLGSLPRRPRVCPETDGALRAAKRPAGPVAAELRGAEPGGPAGHPQTTLARGCFGPDIASLADQRALRAASRIAAARLKQTFAADGFTSAPDQISGSVYVSAFRGLGIFLITATGEDALRAQGAAEIDAELTRLGAQGPGEDELAKVADELAKGADGFQRDPRYWSGALARSTSLGIDPDEIATGAAYFRALTPEMVRDAVRKYYRPDATVSLTLRAAPAAASEAKK